MPVLNRCVPIVVTLLWISIIYRYLTSHYYTVVLSVVVGLAFPPLLGCGLGSWEQDAPWLSVVRTCDFLVWLCLMETCLLRFRARREGCNGRCDA